MNGASQLATGLVNRRRTQRARVTKLDLKRVISRLMDRLRNSARRPVDFRVKLSGRAELASERSASGAIGPPRSRHSLGVTFVCALVSLADEARQQICRPASLLFPHDDISGRRRRIVRCHE